MTKAVDANAGSDKENTSATTDILITSKTENGKSVTTTAGPQDQYTFSTPEVTKVTPSAGSMLGGTALTVEGKYLDGATELGFDPFEEVSSSGTSKPLNLPPSVIQPAAYVASVTKPNSSQTQFLTIRPTASFEKTAREMGVPEDSAVRWDTIVDIPVKGTCGLGQSCHSVTSRQNPPHDLYLTVPISVTSVSPNTGPALGQKKTITISGNGFTFIQNPSVAFCFLDPQGKAASVPATKSSVESDKEIQAEIPDFRQAIAIRSAQGGSGSLNLKTDVVVAGTLKNGQDTVDSPLSTADQYTALGPAVASVTPGKVKPFGGQVVRLEGQGFEGASKVDFFGARHGETHLEEAH